MTVVTSTLGNFVLRSSRVKTVSVIPSPVTVRVYSYHISLRSGHQVTGHSPQDLSPAPRSDSAQNVCLQAWPRSRSERPGDPRHCTDTWGMGHLSIGCRWCLMLPGVCQEIRIGLRIVGVGRCVIHGVLCDQPHVLCWHLANFVPKWFVYLYFH